MLPNSRGQRGRLIAGTCVVRAEEGRPHSKVYRTVVRDYRSSPCVDGSAALSGDRAAVNRRHRGRHSPEPETGRAADETNFAPGEELDFMRR